MKSFTMIEIENETAKANAEEDTVDSVVIRQITELKRRIDQLNSEVRQHEENKVKFEQEISQLRLELNEYVVNKNKIENVNKKFFVIYLPKLILSF